MEKLLQWAVNNSNQEELTKNAEAIRRGEYKPDPSKFNPEVIDAILGKDDATLMKEAVQCIADPNDTIQNKEIALDNLEMLIEGIDNAKNINSLGLWPTLIQALGDKEQAVRTGAAWVCGTAVQNNPDAQNFLEHKGLPPLTKLLKSENPQERAKAQYAISGLLKHCSAAVEQFKSEGGFQVMTNILRDQADDSQTVRKVVFLFNTLMVENSSLATEFKNDGLVDDLDNIIEKYTVETQDEDIVEKALRALHTLVESTQTELSLDMKAHVQKAQSTFGAEELNLSSEEWDLLLK
ncbi:Fes1-domain-containing protein [Hesseltinella vesiculosa]|uniref:Fes1-domain-containing protein n=1 Tax=Hesseltinella vesiculosa TaxID=101127 RepID=A0A1X2GLN6_9FUNG|nr:Fes1-domain-containing protein [Hesseltinella vesiculosa]